MADLITIFKRVKSSELTPFDLFKDVVDNHYLKFRHFYFLIKGVDLRKIDQIDFTSTETTAMFQVYIKDNKYRAKLKDKIDKSFLNDIVFFSTIATLDDNILYVEICMRPPYINEEEIIHAG